MEKTKEEILKDMKADLERRKRQKNVFRVASSSALAVLSILLVMFLLGDPLGILALFGLNRFDLTGVYGGCDDPRNAGSRLCKKEVSSEERIFQQRRRGMGKSNPFSLYGS